MASVNVSSKYGAGVADRIATEREEKLYSMLASANKLALYAPYVCVFPFLAFPSFAWFWITYGDTGCIQSYSQPYSESQMTLTSPMDVYSYVSHITKNLIHRYVQENIGNYQGMSIRNNETRSQQCSYVYFDENLFRIVSYCISGVMLSSFFTQILHYYENEVKEPSFKVPIVCSGVVNFTAFVAHFSMARNWLPVIVSSFGRLNHVARWGEWVTLVPVLMIMMNSIDVRSRGDFLFLWEATLIQVVSIVTGAIASLTQSWDLALILMVISCSCYAHIYYVLYRTIIRYRNLVNEDVSKRRLRDKEYLTFSNREVDDSLSRRTDRLLPINIIQQVEFSNSTMALKLATFCTVTWTIKIGIYAAGVFNLISQTQEAVSQSIMDCVSKSIYARVLCSSHISVLSPEGLLARILRMEERANASIRQFLRFLYHEMTVPLNTLYMSVQTIHKESLSSEDRESIVMAEESCHRIKEVLTQLLSFQEVEEGGLTLKTQPVNLKEIIRDVAASYVSLASERGVTVLQAIDPRIPEYVLSEKNRMTQIVSIMVSNGIIFAKKVTGTCSISAELKNSDDLMDDSDSEDADTTSQFMRIPSNILSRVSAQISFSVRNDGTSFTTEEIQSMFTAYSHLTPGDSVKTSNIWSNIGMSMCIIKQVVEMHGGKVNVHSKAGEGSSFSFDINFDIMDKSTMRGNELFDFPNDHTDRVIHDHPQDVHLKDGPETIGTDSKEPQEAPFEAIAGSKDNIKNTPDENRPLVPEKTGINIEARNLRIDTEITYSIPQATARVEERKPFESKTALVVDDVFTNRKLLQRILERLGFHVDLCEDGDIFVGKIVEEKCSYDAVFLDNMMPRMRGVDAIRIVRQSGYQGFVLGVTGNVLKEDLDEFMLAGCNQVVTKPINYATIINILEQGQVS